MFNLPKKCLFKLYKFNEKNKDLYEKLGKLAFFVKHFMGSISNEDYTWFVGGNYATYIAGDTDNSNYIDIYITYQDLEIPVIYVNNIVLFNTHVNFIFCKGKADIITNIGHILHSLNDPKNRHAFFIYDSAIYSIFVKSNLPTNCERRLQNPKTLFSLAQGVLFQHQFQDHPKICWDVDKDLDDESDEEDDFNLELYFYSDYYENRQRYVRQIYYTICDLGYCTLDGKTCLPCEIRKIIAISN